MGEKGVKKERVIDIGPMVIFLTFIILGLFYVGLRIQSIELLYRISEAKQENIELRRTHEQLILEVAVLRSPSRIAEIATRQLEMKRPSIDQIMIMR
jgi:cell division protein FtsL